MNDRLIRGKYRLGQLLGKGAFSRVYLATDSAGRRYACKVSENSALLLREAGFQKKAGHPLFPECLDAWEEEGRGWLLMEYVPGENLEAVVGKKGFFTPEQAAETGRELAGGLRYLHELRPPLLFRDIKPSNIMREPGGRIRLLDFGCVCPVGECRGTAGTPGFGAPEQFRQGCVQGIAADVYGLGRTLLALTGKNPGGRLGAVLRRCTVERAEERLPDMAWVEELLGACCEKKRFTGVQRAVLQGRLALRKNIWE